IFAKNISVHSIGNLRLLYRGVGRFFEVVPTSNQHLAIDAYQAPISRLRSYLTLITIYPGT
ncbi:hypothetical protein B0H67DRAFT_494777, partial [Lasiosphaeris hirsuta]